MDVAIPDPTNAAANSLGFESAVDAMALSRRALLELPALDNTFGCILIGTFVGLILYGVTLHQAYRYFRMYPRDSPVIKVLVVLALALETFYSAMTMHICYHYLVSNYFDPLELLKTTWSMDLLPLASGLTMLSSQIFFVRRVYLVGPRYRAVAVLAVLLIIAEIVLYSLCTAKIIHIQSFLKWDTISWTFSAGVACAVSAHILLTSVLIISLRQSRTGFSGSDIKINMLILYAVNTGLATGVLSFVSLITSLVYTSNFIFIVTGILGTRMYANTFLAALNSRRSLATAGMTTFGGGGSGSGTGGSSEISNAHSNTSSAALSRSKQLPRAPPHREISIMVQNVSRVDTDVEMKAYGVAEDDVIAIA